MHLSHRYISRFAAALVTAAVVLLAPPIFAENGDGPTNSELVAGMELNGLKRTKSTVVERLLARFVGRSAEEIDLNEVRTVLLETGLFDNIKVSIKNDPSAAPILVVSLEEKWSIVPLPIFAATSDGMIGGLGLIDSNAFGLMDQMIAVALLTPSGWSSFFRYGSEPPDDHSFGWAAMTALEKGSMEVVDDEDKSALEYDAFFLDANFELKRKFGRYFSINSGIGFREHSVDDDVPEAGRVVPLSFGIAARSSFWDGVFLSEKSLSTAAGYSFALIGDGFASVEGRAVLEQALFPGLRAVVRAGAFHAPEAPTVFEAGPPSAAVSILPSHFRSPSLAGISAGFEARVFGFRGGTISALGAYQAAVAEGGESGEVFAHGPTFGIRLYLSKIAVPAVDIGLAYNAETGLWRGAFGIGMQM